MAAANTLLLSAFQAACFSPKSPGTSPLHEALQAAIDYVQAFATALLPPCPETGSRIPDYPASHTAQIGAI
jgi:hypothetical protein